MLPARIPLRPSAQVTTAGTTTGTGLALLRSLSALTAVLNVSAVGDATQAADTLDVYIDASHDGGTTYFNIGRFARIVGVDGVKAWNTLELTGAIVPGSHAESVITSDTTNVTEDEVVVIGSTTYRWRDTLAQAYDVKIGASAAASLDNLKAAINASGTPGTEYFAGTLAHPTVVATDNADTTQKVVARTPGTAANTAATTTTSAHLSWADTTLGGGTGASNPGVAAETVTVGSVVYSFVDVLSETNGAAAIANQVLFGADSAAALDNLKLAINSGAGAGTLYSTGTTAQTLLEATDNTNTSQKVEALTQSADNNSIVTTETLSNGAWSEGATLAHGTLGPGVAARQSMTWSPSLVEASQPVNIVADISSTSGAVRQIGFGDMIRYRGVVAGAEPDFTYSVHCVAKE